MAIPRENASPMPEWAKDTPKKRFPSPYNFSENVRWLWNNLFGPSKKFKQLTDFLPEKTTLNVISPKIKIGFVGDIMRMKNKDLQFSPELVDFVKDVDFLVGNFEGTISGGKKAFMTQEHSEKILDVLETFFPPERFVLSCANNHAGDFGWTAFNKSYQLLKDHHFQTIGRRDEPSILLKNQINVVACTGWSNQPQTPYIVYLKENEDYYNPKADFNILYPHWGYEMQLYPNPNQIEFAKSLLNKWDMIMGHHSHCPQPVTAYEIDATKKLIAYSLGDFCIAIRLKKYHHGIIVKLKLGPGNGGWKVGEVEWKFTHIHRINKSTLEVRL